MTAHRPDLLPLALPRRLGLPFHGICRDGTLTLSDSTTRDYLQPADGSVTYVKHPLAVAAERTPEEIAYDEAKHYQWLDYAYISGYDLCIGGRRLYTQNSGLTGVSWLYCNDRTTWQIRAVLSGTSGASRTITIARKQFGVFRSGDLPEWETLTTGTFTALSPLDGTQVAMTGTQLSFVPQAVTHSQDGGTTVINFRGSASVFDDCSDFCGAVKVVLSTNDDGDVSANIVTLASGTDLLNDVSTASSVPSSWPEYTIFDCAQTNSFQLALYEEGTDNLISLTPMTDDYSEEETDSDIIYNSYHYVTPSGQVRNVTMRVRNYSKHTRTHVMLDANNYEQTEVTEQKLLWQFGTSSDPDVIKILAENTITEITTSNCDTANPCVMGICTDRDYSSERGEEENTSYFSFATWYRDLGDYESLQSRSTAVPQVFPATNNAFQFLMPYIFGGTYYAGSFDIFDVRFNQSDKTDLIVSTDLKPISIDPRTGTRYTATSTVSSVCVI